MQERYANRGFAVVAVNLDRDSKSAQEFLEKNAAPFRVIYDSKGTLAKAYKVAAMPSPTFTTVQGGSALPNRASRIPIGTF